MRYYGCAGWRAARHRVLNHSDDRLPDRRLRAAAAVDCYCVSDSGVSQPVHGLHLVSDHVDDHADCPCDYVCAGGAEGVKTRRG